MHQRGIEKQRAISDLGFADKRLQTAVTFEKGSSSMVTGIFRPPVDHSL
jgi:hypothetical protein